MSYEIRAEYREQFLLPPSLEDWIPSDHPARMIRDFVDSLDLGSLGFKMRESGVGRPNFARDLLLKVWIYAYLEKIRSSRGLERACKNHVALIWLTGCHYPDHNTLWRFWRDNRGCLKQVFRQIVRVALDADLIGLVVHVVDGTKIQSAGSDRSGIKRKDLERQLEELDAAIERIMGEIESQEKEEEGDGGYSLPERLQDAKERKQTIEESLQRLDDEGREHCHTTDEEAQLMKGEGFPKWSYNAQAVVDESSGLIVAEEVTNDATDVHQLVPMLEQVEENLGQVAEENVADAGYRSQEQLRQAWEKGYEVLVYPHPDDLPKNDRFHVSQFRYDKDRDCCVCPEGKELRLSTFDKSRNARIYTCTSWKDCPSHRQCTRAKRGRRSIRIGERHEAIVHQREKRQQEEKRALLRRRQGIIEPVFGHMKEVMGFRRWRDRGMAKVKPEWSMGCLVFNMKKLLNPWREGKLVFG